MLRTCGAAKPILRRGLQGQAILSFEKSLREICGYWAAMLFAYGSLNEGIMVSGRDKDRMPPIPPSCCLQELDRVRGYAIVLEQIPCDQHQVDGLLPGRSRIRRNVPRSPPVFDAQGEPEILRPKSSCPDARPRYDETDRFHRCANYKTSPAAAR